MSDTTLRVTGDQDGIVRLWSPDASRESRNAARRMAAEHLGCKVGHLAFATDLGTSKGGHVLGVAKLSTRKAADAVPEIPARDEVEQWTEGQSADEVIAELRRELAALKAKATPAKGKAKAKAPREVAFLGGHPDAACKTCGDIGLVRRYGERSGHTDGRSAYKTANGAAEAKAKGNAAPCPVTSCTAGKRERKAAKAA